MKKEILTIFLILFGLMAMPALAYVAASPNYQLEKDSVNFGGLDQSSSTNYQTISTLGEIVSGLSNGVGYNASSGYRYMEGSTPAPPTIIPGCTNSTANNYNASATVDDGSCTYGGGGPAIINGCTNAKALNFNSSATVDDGSCLYADVPNVSNFKAIYKKDQKVIALSWEKPVYTEFSSVMIRRSTVSSPTSTSTGQLVYNGLENNTLDTQVSEGTQYYYTAFVLSTDKRNSSGVVTLENIPLPQILGCTNKNATNYNVSANTDDGTCIFLKNIPGCVNKVALNYNPEATVDDGTCVYPGGGGPDTEDGPNDVLGCLDVRALNFNPKANKDDNSCQYSPFVASTTPINLPEINAPSSDWFLRFIQPKERIKTFDNGMKVRVFGDKELTVLFNYKFTPEVLKTIGVTLTDPVDPTKSFSFLMHYNQKNGAYMATIGMLSRKGTYPIDIYLINYKDQAVEHIKGSLIVVNEGLFSAETVERVIVPVAASGLAVGFLPSIYDLFVILARVFSYFTGRRRKREPWGTVYDSVTKQPLDPVYVTANQTDPSTGKPKEAASAISDIDGRFGFFLPAGEYYVSANKTHYRFPSTRLQGRDHDELYDHLYFGGALKTSGEEVININIPMDPIDFDWNEFAKSKTDFFRFYAKRKLWFNRFWRTVFVSGLAFSVYAFVFSPSIWNIIMILLYAGLYLVNRFWRDKRRPLTIYNTQTGEPMPFAILRLFLPDLNQQIKYSVADKYGRFFLLVRPGTYYYTVEEKKIDGTYEKVFQSGVVSLPVGVLTENVYVK